MEILYFSGTFWQITEVWDINQTWDLEKLLNTSSSFFLPPEFNFWCDIHRENYWYLLTILIYTSWQNWYGTIHVTGWSWISAWKYTPFIERKTYTKHWGKEIMNIQSVLILSFHINNTCTYPLWRAIQQCNILILKYLMGFNNRIANFFNL